DLGPSAGDLHPPAVDVEQRLAGEIRELTAIGDPAAASARPARRSCPATRSCTAARNCTAARSCSANRSCPAARIWPGRGPVRARIVSAAGQRRQPGAELAFPTVPVVASARAGKPRMTDAQGVESGGEALALTADHRLHQVTVPAPGHVARAGAEPQ